MDEPRQRLDIEYLRDPELGFGLWPWSRGLLCRLEEDHVFWLEPGRMREYRIPAGYEFDGASVPPVFWAPPFNYLPVGRVTVAALEHDFLCDLLMGGSPWLKTRLGGVLPTVPGAQELHEHFRIRLHQHGVRAAKAEAMAWAVRWFGPGGYLRFWHRRNGSQTSQQSS